MRIVGTLSAIFLVLSIGCAGELEMIGEDPLAPGAPSDEPSATPDHEEPANDDAGEALVVGAHLSEPTVVDPWSYVDDISLEELEALSAELVTAIESATEVIEELEREIAKLEADAVRKADEASALVSQIASRRSDLEDQHRRNLILCAWYGCPGAVSLAVYLSGDARLQELNRELESARAQEATMRSQIAAYAERRDALRVELASLQAEHAALVELMDAGPEAVEETLEILMVHPELRELASRVAVLGQLSGNLGGQIELLTEIRDLAVDLNEVLDRALMAVRRAAERAEQLANESQRALLDIIKILTSGDPSAAAERWLQSQLARETRSLLKALDLPVRLFVEHLLADSPEDFENRVDSIVDGMLRGLARVTLSESATGLPLAIADNDLRGVSRQVQFPLLDPVSSGRVRVHIEHPYVGDLRVELRHWGRTQVLHDRTGSSDDSLDLDVRLSGFKGTRAVGAWTLVVIDEAESDVGTLVSFEVDLEVALIN